MAPSLLACRRISVGTKGKESLLRSFSWPCSDWYIFGERHACNRRTKKHIGQVRTNPSKLRTYSVHHTTQEEKVLEKTDSKKHLVSDSWDWQWPASIASRSQLQQNPTLGLRYILLLHEYRPLSLSERIEIWCELSHLHKQCLVPIPCHNAVYYSILTIVTCVFSNRSNIACLRSASVDLGILHTRLWSRSSSDGALAMASTLLLSYKQHRYILRHAKRIMSISIPP